MIRDFVYRGRHVVIDDSPSHEMDHMAPKAPESVDKHGHDHTGGHSPGHKDPAAHPGHPGHGGNGEHGGHNHGRISIRIDDRTIFADRVASGYFFMSHDWPFERFTTIDE